ncbi:UNVERIFIED_CONTAM: hypothetical protein PYX00_011081 [Menopon gallinae]|uniref:Biotin carboxylase n=1 Tax=Menopon gallinae TaxID=328185 RepID=A0AAW2H5V3_9NEOP
MNIKTVAVYSNVDKDSMHTKIADEAICIGPKESINSYNNKQAIISAALVTNCDAIFPGYGFLSENAAFAKMVEQHGLIFIGPSYEHIEIMGDKITAKETAKKLGLPLVPGSKGEINSVEEAKKIASELGYPIVIKASAGGGGKGIRMVYSEEQIEEAFSLTKNEAKSFANDTLYIEKCIVNPRHIEVQILGDKHGNVIHLFERECSLQRNNQKILEEAPSIALSNKERDYICNLTAKAMHKLGYYMTESITGLDLIYEMIKIASGKELTYKQEDIKINGHAIEFRILAEDPLTFLPRPGKITYFHPPAGLGVRLDTSIYNGYTILPYYDSMIAKLIIHGRNRSHCVIRAIRALEEFIVEGIKTSIPLHIALLNNENFNQGTFHIKWLEESFLPNLNKIIDKNA